MLKYSGFLFCLLITCCSSGRVRDLPALEGSNSGNTYLYGYGNFRYGARFKIELENPESGAKKVYQKGWNVFPGFTPDNRSLLFAFPMASGKWVLKTIQVSNGPGSHWDLPVAVNIPFEIAEGKGNFLGEIAGSTQGAGYTFNILSGEQKKSEIDKMMAEENPGFQAGMTLVVNLPSTGPFK